MKGKKILTLVSLAMGVAIVGGTFAAWAVTDNADPFGIKVSPGQVGPDKTQYVTLSYGTSTFANVDNLKAGEPRLAGSILLKADTSDGTVFPYALFDIGLQDQSTGKAAGDAKLVDLLKVDIYDGKVYKDGDSETNAPILNEMVYDATVVSQETFNTSKGTHSDLFTITNDVAKRAASYTTGTKYYYIGEALTKIGYVPLSTTANYVKDASVKDADSFAAAKLVHGKLFKKVSEGVFEEVTAYGAGVTEYFYDANKEASIHVTIPSGDGLFVSAVVSLDASTDAKTLEQIAKDVVYLQMNLNKDPNQTYVTSSKLYVNKTIADGETMYCYAWSATNKNAEWPGIAMEKDASGYLAYELKNDFDKVVFNVSSKAQSATEWTTSWQTVDLSIGDEQRNVHPTFTPNTQPVEGGTKYDGTWSDAPTPIEEGYYVVGNSKGWNPVEANKMIMEEGNDKHYTKPMHFEAGEMFKVCNQNKTVWFSSASTWPGCGFTIDPVDGNLVVAVAGDYTVNLFTEGDGGNCVTLGTPTVSGFQMLLGDTPVDLVFNEHPLDPEVQEWSIQGQQVEANTIITFRNNTVIPSQDFKIETIESGGASASFEFVTGTGIKCKTSGKYDFYLKLKSGQDKVYIADSAA